MVSYLERKFLGGPLDSGCFRVGGMQVDGGGG